jgi:hypothetical protein
MNTITYSKSQFRAQNFEESQTGDMETKILAGAAIFYWKQCDNRRSYLTQQNHYDLIAKKKQKESRLLN